MSEFSNGLLAEKKSKSPPGGTKDEKHKFHRNAFSSGVMTRKADYKGRKTVSEFKKIISHGSLTMKGAKRLTLRTLRQ